VIGQREIRDLFTVYMSGIRYVHDQTVRHLNKGLHPDEVSRLVDLPQSLSSHDYLQQFYGTTIWSAKAVYENYVGWFSGDVVELIPLTPRERSERLIGLLGESQLLYEAESALRENDLRWALELSSHVFRVHPSNIEARDVRLRCLRTMAGQQTNPLARNYYLSTALDDHKFINWELNKVRAIADMEVKEILHFMKYKLKAEDTDGVNMTLLLCFDDTKEAYSLQILYSVLTIDQMESCSKARSSYDVRMTTTTFILKDILFNKLSTEQAYKSGEIKIEGTASSLKTFLSYFEK